MRRRDTGQIGYVTRACPSGNHIPAQAHVMFDGEGTWVPTKELERAYA